MDETSLSQKVSQQFPLKINSKLLSRTGCNLIIYKQLRARAVWNSLPYLQDMVSDK